VEQIIKPVKISCFNCTLKLIRNIYVIQKVVAIGGGYFSSSQNIRNELPKIFQPFELFQSDVTLKAAQLVHVSIFEKYGIASNLNLSGITGDFLHLPQFTKVKPTKKNSKTWKILFVN